MFVILMYGIAALGLAAWIRWERDEVAVGLLWILPSMLAGFFAGAAIDGAFGAVFAFAINPAGTLAVLYLACRAPTRWLA